MIMIASLLLGTIPEKHVADMTWKLTELQLLTLYAIHISHKNKHLGKRIYKSRYIIIIMIRALIWQLQE